MKGIILVNEFYDEAQPGHAIALERLCGRSLVDRHLRTLIECGVDTIHVIVPTAGNMEQAVNEEIAKCKGKVEVVSEIDAVEGLGVDDDVDLLVIAGDYLIEKRYIDYLIKAEAPCLLVDNQSSEPDRSVRAHPASIGCALVPGRKLKALLQTGMHRWCHLAASLAEDQSTAQIDVAALPTYHHSIQRHRKHIWVKIIDSDTLAMAKKWLIDGAQKGSLDLPAQKLHAPIENFLVSRLCEMSITPNQITLITNIAAWSVTWAILSGYIWPGLVGAAIVGIVDGLDGKLARVKMMTSKFGEFEHLFDMLFEYSWWLSLGWVLGGGSIDSTAFMLGVVLVALNFTDTWIAIIFWLVLGRTYGRTIDNYTPFELSVRRLSGRRNIYIWLLLLTGPLIGLDMALWLCVWWGVGTIAIRGGRMLWLFGKRQPPMDFAF